MQYFTSDLHFNHKNIRIYCPGREKLWSSLEDMNEGLISRFNEVVGQNDDVYIIGDFAMGDKKQIPGLAKRLNGNKYLILGNHDYNYHDAKVRPEILAADFKAIHTDLYLKIDGKSLYLCHIPQELPIGCDYMLSGHVHESYTRATYLNGQFTPDPEGRIINVGVDVSDYRPMTLDQLLQRPYTVGEKHRI